MDKVVGKIIVLREICANKTVLFGPFSEEITTKRKVELWNGLLTKAKSLGLVSYDKDYKYMRDIYWQNLKRSALGKRDSIKSGKERKYSPIDDLVFEILQKPPLQTLPQAEVALTAKHENDDSNDSTEVDPAGPDSLNPKDNENPNIVYLESEETIFPSPKKRKKKIASDESLRKKKMALQVEQIEMQNYKLKLEVYEMEQKLGFEPSKYTKGIANILKTVNNNAIALDQDGESEESDSDA